MSFGDFIQDAASWVSEEIRKSINDLSDAGPPEQIERHWAAGEAQSGRARGDRPVSKVVLLDSLTNWCVYTLDFGKYGL